MTDEQNDLNKEIAQWRCNSRENKLIAEENSRRADRAEAKLAEIERICQRWNRVGVTAPAGSLAAKILRVIEGREPLEPSDT